MKKLSNRTIKNIIMILVIVLLIGAMVYTGYYAKENTSTTISMNDGGTPPSMDSEMQEKPDEEGSDETTQPEKPSVEENSEAPEKPDEDTSSDSTPPEKPSDDSTTETNEGIPSMPSGEVPSMPSDMSTTSNAIDAKYYYIFACEGFVLGLVLSYLIVSGFNKKSFKETFENKDKIAIVILATILVTGVTSFAGVKVTNMLLDSTSNQGGNNNPNGRSDSSSNQSYTGVTTIEEDTEISDTDYSSSNSNENAVIVTGDVEVTMDNITVTKTGDADSGDDSNFYGTNSAIIAKDGATLNIKNATITTDADGANGVFSYGGSATTNNTSSDGTTINISDSKITTTGDNAGGIMTTGGGTTNATNLTISTSGTSSAAIRSDRGGGTVNVSGGTYKTAGQGSPSVYSTADITVDDATLTSTASEGIVIEGANSVTLTNSTLTDSNTKLNGKSTTYKNIFIYQSMSGDASEGTATFTAKNNKITTNNGDTFYVTNTNATISLENNTFVNNDSDGVFLRIEAGSWGSTGSNGGNVTLKLTKQTVTGDIYVDSISTLAISMNNSDYIGAINSSNEASEITLTLDSDSTITLTGDTYLTSLTDEDTTYSNINLNGYKLYINGTLLDID